MNTESVINRLQTCQRIHDIDKKLYHEVAKIIDPVIRRVQRKLPIMSGRNFGVNIRLGRWIFRCFFRTCHNNTKTRCAEYDYLFYKDNIRKNSQWMFFYKGKQLDMVQIGRRIKTTRTINWDGFIPLHCSLFDYKKIKNMSKGWSMPVYPCTGPKVTYF